MLEWSILECERYMLEYAVGSNVAVRMYFLVLKQAPRRLVAEF